MAPVNGWFAVAAIFVGVQLACVPLDGGAVEIGWVVRDEEGRTRSCEDAGIVEVRLRMAPVEGGEARVETFACGDEHGQTVFDVSEQTYLFSLEALDSEGEALAPDRGVCVPPALTRQVVRGEVTDLAVWLIRAARDLADSGCE